MEPRLVTDIWVRAYLRRLELAGIPAYVTAHGDTTSGAVLVKCATLDDRASLWQRGYDLTTGERNWMVLKAGPEEEVDATLKRERMNDPDLWVIEIESRDGITLLDEAGLRE